MTSPLPADNERLAQLQRQIRGYKPIPIYYNHACQAFVFIGSIASIFRFYKGWSYDEAPLWWNLAFWGGYLAVIFVFGPIVAWGIVRDWRMGKVVREFEKEMRSRGLEPYRVGAENDGEKGVEGVEGSERRYTDEKPVVVEEAKLIEVDDEMQG